MEFYNYKFYIIYKIPSWYWKHITFWTGPGFPKLSSEIILQLFRLGWKEDISRNKQVELFKASSVLRSAVDPSSMILLTQNQTKEKKSNTDFWEAMHLPNRKKGGCSTPACFCFLTPK